MMRLKKRFKIAVYSGDIPSTTFIERLIQGLTGSRHHIFLFGAIKSRYPSKHNITVVGYKHTTFNKLLHLIKYSFLLFLFKRQAKLQLDDMLKSEKKDSLYAKVKYYPVLWHRPDVFHVQWAKSIEDWLWVQAFGIKLVLSLRGAHINYSPIADPTLAALYKRSFPKVDGFHAVSRAIGKTAELYGADPSKIKVVYSGLDLKPPMVSEIQKTTTLNILSVGRPHWVKGYTYALDACKLLKDKGIAFNYSIIGAASDLELVYQVKDLNLSNEVTLTQPLPFNEVQKVIQQADVLVLSSVKEGIANVVLEAMALGTLVVSTDCGGLNEVITDGENGFLVPIRDSKVLAETLQNVMQLTDEAKKLLIANAKATIERQHASPKMLQDMEDLYKKVMSY